MAVRYNYQKIEPTRVNSESSKEDTDLVNKIKVWQRDSSTLVTAWETSQEKWHRMRMRKKKPKNFPFPGCSNLRMPTVETKIRKLKASLYNVLFGIRPVCSVVPQPGTSWEAAQKVEKALDHIIMDRSDIKSKAIIAIDQMLEKGFYLIKPYWDKQIIKRVETFSLDDISVEEALMLFGSGDINALISIMMNLIEIDLKEDVVEDNINAVAKAAEDFVNGKNSVKIELFDVIKNVPDIKLCSPERVYVPTTSGVSPQDCEYIIDEFYVPFARLKENASYKGWDEAAVKKIEDAGRTNLSDKNIDVEKDEREGVERLQSASKLVKIWECYCYEDVNNDGNIEKSVITIAPDFCIKLRKILLPFYSGKFPFVKIFYELTDDRWFSHRGIPELIEDIVKEIDMQHNQKIDYQSMANSPLFLARAGQINKNTLQFAFGQILPVNGMMPLDDIIKPMNKHNPNIEFSYEREDMILATKIEELIGQPDYALQSMINKRQPRTLGEVQLQSQSMQQMFSLDANMLTTQFTEVWNWVWELLTQYGDEEYEFMYYGQSTQGERVKLSREELQGKYKITVRGNDNNTNAQLKLDKAQTILVSMQNPIALQSGVITPYNIANAYKRFYQMLDIPNWEELMTPPDQILKQMQQPQNPPPPPNIKLKGEDLTEAEQAQLLKMQGIEPDFQGRIDNRDKAKSSEALDQIAKVADTIGGF